VLKLGVEQFAALGTGTSKGTKVCALSGKVERTGLVEVAMGTPLRRIVFDIGGGPANGKKFKAVQIGGPSGGCIPTEHLDIEIDYESLKRVGAMMGSGGLVVMDEDTCWWSTWPSSLWISSSGKLGKCIPCRKERGGCWRFCRRITRGAATRRTPRRWSGSMA
jgi:NADH:ubiquinone oxidoreductase subunit F (NADH-binding)